MKSLIKEYLIEGPKATDYHSEIFVKASLKQLPAGVSVIGVEGNGLADVGYYLHIESKKGVISVKIKPERMDKLRIIVMGQNPTQQTAKTKLKKIFGGKID